MNLNGRIKAENVKLAITYTLTKLETMSGTHSKSDFYDKQLSIAADEASKLYGSNVNVIKLIITELGVIPSVYLKAKHKDIVDILRFTTLEQKDNYIVKLFTDNVKIKDIEIITDCDRKSIVKILNKKLRLKLEV